LVYPLNSIRPFEGGFFLLGDRLRRLQPGTVRRVVDRTAGLVGVRSSRNGPVALKRPALPLGARHTAICVYPVFRAA
jgi:hypothetical protein